MMSWESDGVGKAKQLWSTWGIRVFMLTSLLIQILLTFLAPYRKRCSSGLFSLCIWLMYLAADTVALFTIGLISSSQGRSPQGTELLAFWAPFLLLHLGGPDTITALALEDNELWLRHALQFGTQVVITVYVFAQSVHANNRLWVPTMLMFINGSIRYIERTSALYYASSDTFRGSQAEESDLRDDCFYTRRTNFKKSEIAGQAASSCSEIMENVDMIKKAYISYSKFKGLLVDSFVSVKRREDSRCFFLSITASEALKIIEIELNIIYDVFYTKVFLWKRKRAYVRTLSCISVIASLLLFISKYQSNYNKIDVRITLALLGGAAGLDMCAALQFIISDRCIITMSTGMARVLQLLLCTNGSSRARWSWTISQYNLFERCKDVPSYFKYIFLHRLKHVLIGWLYVHNEPVTPKLMAFITEELYKKANLATDDDKANEICLARGHLAFQDEYREVSESLKRWTVDIDYDESVLTWHLATDICYGFHTSGMNDLEACYRQHSKHLSDYLLYVMFRQQAMVSSLAGLSEIRFADTIREVKKSNSVLLKQHVGLVSQKQGLGSDLINEYCGRMLENLPAQRPILPGNRKNKSVEFDALHLANRLRRLEGNQWEVTSKVWIELLCYAAVRSSSRSHIALLNSGGELITIVWLLMAHLGLGERFHLHNWSSPWSKVRDKRKKLIALAESRRNKRQRQGAKD